VKTTEAPARADGDLAAGVALPLRWGILLLGWACLAAGAAAASLQGLGLAAALGAGAALVAAAALALARPAEALARAGRAAVDGGPGEPLEPGGPAEVRAAGRHLLRLREGLASAVRELSGASGQLGSDSAALRAGVAHQSALAARQATAVMETGTTATEIAQTARAAAAHAEEVLRGAERAEDLSAEGQEVLGRAVETIRALAAEVQHLSDAISDSAQRSRHIGEIVVGLKDLAEQTNLLAVNASLEAVKAGEHGRGFSVVAAEMSNLAEQSMSAAGEVRGILVEIERGTSAALDVAQAGTLRAHGALDLAGEAARAIAGLTTAIRDSSVTARQIANHTRQQGIGVEQIVAALEELSAVSQEAVAGTRAVEQVTDRVAALAGRLGEQASGAPGRRAS